ncbi:MAG TPA: acyl-CoA dehydrogenase family protein [Terrimesophilobacter sp.]|nr:acyl-CoA dehydrogenase family protein [Terrimesophilobacter sp.]
MNTSEETQDVRALAAEYAERNYAPIAAEIDAQRRHITVSERQELGSLGMLGLAHSEEYGGSGSPLVLALAAIEEFAKVCRPAAFQIFEANVGPAQVIAHFGTPEQRERWLPGIISGEITMAVGISEPDAGSAATDLRTSARPSEGGWVLNGSKRWISNGGEADLYLVYTRLSEASGAKGIGALVVESSAPGVTFGSPERLMGFRGIPSSDIYFDDVEVPQENLVVAAGDFRKLFTAFSIERLGNATMSLAIGQASLDKTIEYVQARTQFGKPLIEFQSVQLQLADMLTQVEAARLLIDRAATRVRDGVMPNALEVSIAKANANEMAKKVSDTAMQLHGANGYTEEFGIERLHRDAHGWAIAGGTPSIQRVRIVSELLGRKFDQRA